LRKKCREHETTFAKVERRETEPMLQKF
jgi:hypothetical protein